MKLLSLLAFGIVTARDRFLQRFTVQIEEGVEAATRIAAAHRLTLEVTSWPDLFIFQAIGSIFFTHSSILHKPTKYDCNTPQFFRFIFFEIFRYRKFLLEIYLIFT